MKKYFVVSDVHSFFTIMMDTLIKNGFSKDDPEHVLVVCGDLFDRGNESLQLYNFVRSLPEDRFIYIRGNHEDLLQDCYMQLVNGELVSSHHILNGTLGTILDLCKIDRKFEMQISYNPKHLLRGDVMDFMPEILDYINSKCVNYLEISNYILVHGWIPCYYDDVNIYNSRRKMTYKSDWRNASQGEWNESRWINGMLAWKQGVREPGKTIICGHWHCSYGWSWIKQERQEFPNKSKKDWKKSFEPFIDEGIVAIDACTAYSEITNCFIIDADD